MSLARLYKKPNENLLDKFELQKLEDDSAFIHILRAIDILEFSLGFDHPETGDAYSIMGIAYQEVGNFQDASIYLRKSFCTFFKSMGPEDPITLNIYD